MIKLQPKQQTLRYVKTFISMLCFPDGPSWNVISEHQTTQGQLTKHIAHRGLQCITPSNFEPHMPYLVSNLQALQVSTDVACFNSIFQICCEAGNKLHLHLPVRPKENHRHLETIEILSDFQMSHIHSVASQNVGPYSVIH